MYKDFGRHESGNKVSYNEFKKYLEDISKTREIDPPINLYTDILPKIKVKI